MPALTPSQAAQLQAALTARLNAIEAAQDQAVPGTPAGAHGLPVAEVETAPVDKATVRLINDLALEAAGHQQALLALLRHALAKMADGSYGVCEECGQDIGFPRLHARPEARLCIVCQTRREIR